MFIRKYTIMTIVTVIMALALNTGCKKNSSDDNPVTPPVNNGSSLVGTWNLSKLTVLNADSSKTSYTPAQAGLLIVMIFRTDNTAQMTTTDQNGTTVNKGTYTFTNNVITLKDSVGNTRSFTVILNGNLMTFPLDLLDPQNNVVHTILEFTRQTGIRWE